MGTIDDRLWLDDPVWQALENMRIEPEGASLTFTRRLARENGWSARYAASVIAEYKRFLYLAATSPTSVTPSEQVDQAWHLHLAYTRHYWGELCARIIGRPLHHGPTAGGGAEGRKYRALYAETLARYRSTFGAEPPAEIWPPTEQRFAVNYQWVDRSRNFVLPRRSVSIAGLAGGAVLLAACTALAADSAGSGRSSVLDSLFDFMTGSTFGFFAVMIGLFIILIVTVSIINHFTCRGSHAERTRRKRGDNSDSSGSVDTASGGWADAGGAGAAAGGAAFMAGGGDFGGSGADGGWDGGGSDSGGDSGCSSSGCGGGCGGGD